MNLYLFFKDNLMTEWMQHFDVFEKFKVIVEKPVFLAGADESAIKRILENAMVFDTSEPYNLIALFSADQIFWRDEKVKVVSDGCNWQLLDDLIKVYQSKLDGRPGENEPVLSFKVR